MAYNPVADALRNTERRFNPQPGDLWVERASIVVFAVLEMTEDYVTIVQEKIHTRDGSYFDLKRAVVLTRQEFSRKPCYGGTGELANKCWCTVTETPIDWVVQMWADWLAEGNPKPSYIPPNSVRANYR